MAEKGNPNTEEQSLSFGEELKNVIGANKKIWMTPVILAVVVIVLAVLFGSTGDGSFIYSLF